MTRIFLYLFIIFLSIGSRQSQAAQKNIGVVALLHGRVWCHQGEKKTLIKLGQKILEGDLIETDKKSYVKILLNDDSIFDLGAETKFKFEKFIENKNEKERKETFDFIYGKMRSLFTKKANQGNIKIHTPNVSMGVRGTEILANVQTVQKETVTEIALLSGSIQLQTNSNLANSSSTQTLETGMLFNSQSLNNTQNFTQSLTQLTTQQMQKLVNPNPGSVRPTFLNEITHKNQNSSPTQSPDQKGAELKEKKANHENKTNNKEQVPGKNQNNSLNLIERQNKNNTILQDKNASVNPELNSKNPFAQNAQKPQKQTIQQLQNNRLVVPGMGVTNPTINNPALGPSLAPAGTPPTNPPPPPPNCHLEPTYYQGTVIGQHLVCN